MPGEPWNMDAALEQVGGDPGLLNELIQLFLEDSAQLLEKLRAAVAAQDAGQVEHVAHTLKGSAMNFAADRTRDLAFELEKMGRAGDLKSAANVFGELEVEYERLATSMRAA